MTKSFKAGKHKQNGYKSEGRPVDRFRSDQAHKHVKNYPQAAREHSPQHHKQTLQQLQSHPVNRINIPQPTVRTSTPNQPTKNGINGKAVTEMFSSQTVSQYMHWKSSSRAGPGLFNHGNTCFLNSTIQCLLHTPALSQVLIKESKMALNRVDSSSILQLYQRYKLLLYSTTLSQYVGTCSALPKYFSSFTSTFR